MLNRECSEDLLELRSVAKDALFQSRSQSPHLNIIYEVHNHRT